MEPQIILRSPGHKFITCCGMILQVHPRCCNSLGQAMHQLWVIQGRTDPFPYPQMRSNTWASRGIFIGFQGRERTRGLSYVYHPSLLLYKCHVYSFIQFENLGIEKGQNFGQRSDVAIGTTSLRCSVQMMVSIRCIPNWFRSTMHRVYVPRWEKMVC